MSNTNNNIFQSLTEKSVWIFTKQETSFDEAYRATLLFSNISDIETTNVQTYFSQNAVRFNVSTTNHRMLVMSQFWGLLTKTNFFRRGTPYKNESPTSIFLALNLAIDIKQYNQIKTEQILKLKIHALIDTESNNKNYCLLPVPFMYAVLKKLQKEHNISRVSNGHLWTYILTCKNFNELEDSVTNIANNEPISPHILHYKSVSRVITLIKKNIRLFNFDKEDNIYINPEFDEYFDDKFNKQYSINGFTYFINEDDKYKEFLYNLQNFGINLIDTPDEYINLDSVKLDEITNIPVSITNKTDFVYYDDAAIIADFDITQIDGIIPLSKNTEHRYEISKKNGTILESKRKIYSGRKVEKYFISFLISKEFIENIDFEDVANNCNYGFDVKFRKVGLEIKNIASGGFYLSDNEIAHFENRKTLIVLISIGNGIWVFNSESQWLTQRIKEIKEIRKYCYNHYSQLDLTDIKINIDNTINIENEITRLDNLEKESIFETLKTS